MINFSVIIATHNRPLLLERALLSLQQQTYPCHQVIVVSDVIDPLTYTTANKNSRGTDIFVQRKGIPGPAESRNLALKLVSGNYVLFLDDDDSFRPDFLDKIAQSLPAHASDTIFYTDFEVLYEKRQAERIVEESSQVINIANHDHSSVFTKNFIPINCLIYPVSALHGVQFDNNIAYEDWDFILCACAHARLQHLPITGPVIHKDTVGTKEHRGEKNKPGLLQDYIKVYTKHPPPNAAIAAQRERLFTSIGIDIDAFVNNHPLASYD